RLAVDVTVAGRAVGVPAGQAEHRLGVAAIAQHADVLGVQREARVGVMVELHRLQRSPGAGVMAAVAASQVVVQFAVRAAMTALAGPGRQQKGRPARRRLLFVALVAVDDQVAPAQRKTADLVLLLELWLAAEGLPGE